MFTLNCEICGAEIRGKPNKVMLESTTLNVCSGCAHLGTPIKEQATPQMKQGQGVKPVSGYQVMPAVQQKKEAMGPAPRRAPRVEIEVSEDYPAILRGARQKAGLSQEELAKKVAERVTVIKQLERGDLFPDDKVRRKLEKELHVSLLETEGVSETVAKDQTGGGAGLTLGDMINIKKK